MIVTNNSGICAFPDCERETAPPPPTGGRSRYCIDPEHNPTTAYRARRRQRAPAPAEQAPADPVELRERFEQDLARLEATITDVRRALAPPAASAAAADARIAELEHELAEATWGRTAAEAALEVAIEQTRVEAERADRAEAATREWVTEAGDHIEAAKAERDTLQTRLAEAETALKAAEERAYVAEEAWRTLDWQLAEQTARADRAEAALQGDTVIELPDANAPTR
jgi:chromosome segregation ATPase